MWNKWFNGGFGGVVHLAEFAQEGFIEDVSFEEALMEGRDFRQRRGKELAWVSVCGSLPWCIDGGGQCHAEVWAVYREAALPAVIVGDRLIWIQSQAERWNSSLAAFSVKLEY